MDPVTEKKNDPERHGVLLEIQDVELGQKLGMGIGYAH